MKSCHLYLPCSTGDVQDMVQALGMKKVSYPATVDGRSGRDGANVAVPNSGRPAIGVLIGETLSGDSEGPGTVDAIDHC